MTKQLPLVPSIDHLRHQAKNLLELRRVGDSGAVAALCEVFPEFCALSIVQIAASVRLHHTQDVVAWRYGSQRWFQLCESVELERRATSALSAAMEDPKMEDLDYRAGIARSKRLPEIGTSRLSQYGVRYDVVDYMPAITPAGAARARAGGLETHVNDLLPIIWFPEMSDRLYELYIETDCVTTKPLIFFDTIPTMHPSTAAPGLNQVLTLNNESPLYIHFDAAQLDETIIAHELGHVWVEKVEQIEDYRHPSDQSDLARITQFYHVQSFVMDLRVNDLLERRGFDMSIIARHQAESICNFADCCARKAPIRSKRVLAGVINTVAGALLEMERFPAAWGAGIKSALDMIEVGLPEAFGPAKGFVRSVLRYGYADSAAVMRVVDECAMISFAATGESFDPDEDLIEVENSEPKWDKRPDFLSCLPLDAKLQVCKEAARHGITGRAKYDIVVRYPHRAEVVVSDPNGEMLEPICLNYSLPAPPPNPHLMPGAPIPDLPVGSAYIPPLGTGISRPSSPSCGRQDAGSVHDAVGRQHSIGSNRLRGGGPYASMNTPIPDPFKGLPDDVRATLRVGNPIVVPGPPDFESASNNSYMGQLAEIHQRNEELRKKRAEEDYRQRLLQMQMMERHYESYSGNDLKPLLTPAGEEYVKMHPRQNTAALAPVRNYMAGLGRWISQVGFARQMAGESVYGYAMNNPVTYIDPDGNAPGKWGWYGWWVRQNQKLLHDCIAAGLTNGNCSGLNNDKVSKMMRCIIGCELDNLPGPGSKDYPKGYDIMQPDPGYPHGGVGPCRLTGGAQWGGFTYPNTNWRKDPCDNIKAGIALLCFDIKNRNDLPNSYTLPGDWAGDKVCYNRCMAYVPKRITNPPAKKRNPK